MKKILKAAIAGGFVAFIWTNISWMALPWHWTTIGGVENELPIVDALKDSITEDGIYIVPYSADHSPESQAEIHSRMAEGPFAFMMVRPKGIKISMAKMMIFGLLFNIILSAIFAFLANKTNGLNYKQKAGFIAMMALSGAMVIVIPNINWWHFPLNYSLINLADTSITWGLAGLAIGKLTD